MLRDLDKSERVRDYGYCRYITIEEVNNAIRGMHRGGATGLDEILIDFWKYTRGAGMQ